MKLTVKQEKFITYYFQLGNATEAAVKAGYSKKNAVVIASQNLTKLNVQARLKELQEKVASEKIMSVKERKERLSEIARTNLTQFMELGQDGSWVNLGAETPNTAAIQEIHSRTEYDDNGSKPTVYTSIKLHDPLKAIEILNKMEKVYEPDKKDNINVNVNVAVISAKELSDDELASIASRGSPRVIDQKESPKLIN
jgi:phage terminase small subunit